MRFKVFTKKDLATTTWQGGTTTQLYIYPENSSYLERNFDFRLSTAKVESETSQFTSLPNIHRKLLVLEGSIIINHADQYSKKLDKFDLDTFEGNWKTSAIGTCTDFNLMSTKNNDGGIEAFQLAMNYDLLISNGTNSKWLILYVYSGKISIEVDNSSIIIENGSVIVFNEENDLQLLIKGVQDSEVVVSKI
jgi:uncharacterized protein